MGPPSAPVSGSAPPPLFKLPPTPGALQPPPSMMLGAAAGSDLGMGGMPPPPMVPPGYCAAALAAAARSSGLPFLPGVQTVSEAMKAADQGFQLLKFFPADAAGGMTWLQAVGAPLAGLSFCPTGGITAGTAPSYLALANVACVGGSWVAPRVAVATGDWQSVERLAAAASTLKGR